MRLRKRVHQTGGFQLCYGIEIQDFRRAGGFLDFNVRCPFDPITIVTPRFHAANEFLTNGEWRESPGRLLQYLTLPDNGWRKNL